MNDVAWFSCVDKVKISRRRLKPVIGASGFGADDPPVDSSSAPKISNAGYAVVNDETCTFQRPKRRGRAASQEIFETTVPLSPGISVT